MTILLYKKNRESEKTSAGGSDVGLGGAGKEENACSRRNLFNCLQLTFDKMEKVQSYTRFTTIRAR